MRANSLVDLEHEASLYDDVWHYFELHKFAVHALRRKYRLMCAYGAEPNYCEQARTRADDEERVACRHVLSLLSKKVK